MLEQSAGDWRERLVEDSHRLDEASKMTIARTYLIHCVQLTEEEAEVFLDFDLGVQSDDFDEVVVFSRAEGKVAYFFSGSPEDSPDGHEVGRELFRSSLAKILGGFYSERKLGELLGTSELLDREYMIVIWLLGWEHPITKRVRNAYLPAITDLYEVDSRGVHNLMDDSLEDCEDPTDLIDRFLGREA